MCVQISRHSTELLIVYFPYKSWTGQKASMQTAIEETVCNAIQSARAAAANVGKTREARDN